MNSHRPQSLTQYFPFFYVVYTMTTYLSMDAYLPAMPTIASQFNVSQEKIQLSLTLFFLGNLISQPIAGVLSDRYGRRVLLLFGGVLFIVSSLMVVIPWFNILLFARFLQGIALTSMLVTGFSTIHSFYQQEEAIKRIAWLGSVTILSPALGPLLGAVIMKLANWESIFIFLAVVAFFALIGLFYCMPETNNQQEHSSFEKASEEYWSTLTDWDFLKPMVAGGALFAVMIAWNVCGPFFIIKTLNYSVFTFGFIQALVLTGFIIGSQLLETLLSKYSLKGLSTLSVTIVGIFSLISVFFIRFSSNELLNLIVLLFPIHLGLGIGYSVFNRLCIECNDKPMGIKISLSGLGMNVSALLSSIVATSFFSERITSFSVYILGLAALAVFFGFYTLPIEPTEGVDQAK